MASSIYGTDTSCGPDGYRPGVLVSGLVLVGQACYRRLKTRRGALLDDPDYGLRLEDFLCAEYSLADAQRIGDQVRLEIMKDDRIERVDIVSSVAGEAGDLSVTLDLEVFCGAGSFAFTVLIGALDVKILGLPGAEVSS